MKKKLLLIYLFASISLFMGCTSDNNEDIKETYTIELSKEEYKGYLKSKHIDSITVDDVNILVDTGAYVKGNENLTAFTEKAQLTKETLEQNRNNYEENYNKLEININKIQDKDISISPNLVQEANNIQEQIQELNYSLQNNELSKKEIEQNYNNNVNNLTKEIEELKSVSNKNLEKGQLDTTAEVEIETEIETQSPTKGDSETSSETVMEIENNNDEFLSEIGKLQDEINSAKEMYNVEMSRLELNNKQINETLVRYNKQYNQLITGDSNNLIVIDTIEGLQTEKDINKEAISELDMQISEYEDKIIIAPYDAQVEIIDNTITFYSDEKQFVFQANEKQMHKLKDTKETLVIEYLGYQGKLVQAYILFDSHNSVVGESSFYNMVYNIEWNNEVNGILSNSTASMIYTEPNIYIPKNYVGEDENGYYVVMADEKKHIEGESSDKGWSITSGVEVGDVVESVEVLDD